MQINGRVYEGEVEPRTLLSDFIRHQAGLTGTHVGCEHGVCGACTVQLEGEPIRACLMLAVQANGRALRTVEGLAGPDGELTPLQRAFTEHHALQCGFCTAGFLMTADALLCRREREVGEAAAGEASSGEASSGAAGPGAAGPGGIPPLTETEVREELAGNLCRCTGYEGIVAAVLAVLGTAS